MVFMSDRMLEICSTILMILVAFAIFLVLVDWMEPVLKFAKGVGDAIIMIGGSGSSILGMRIRGAVRSRSSLYDDDRW